MAAFGPFLGDGMRNHKERYAHGASALSSGAYFTVFCAIFTVSRTGPNRSIWRRCTPRAAKLAAGEKCRVASELVHCAMVMNLLWLGSVVPKCRFITAVFANPAGQARGH